MADGDFDPYEVRNRARAAICGLLIDAIRNDRYPSSTMMDLVESNLSDDQLPAYASALMQKIEEEQFPSMDMIKRVLALT